MAKRKTTVRTIVEKRNGVFVQDKREVVFTSYRGLRRVMRNEHKRIEAQYPDAKSWEVTVPESAVA